MSRAPIREALIELEVRGLVDNKKSWTLEELYKLPQVIAGDALGELVDALTTEHQAKLLAEQGGAS